MIENFRRTVIVGTSLIIGSIVIFSLILYWLSGKLYDETEQVSANRMFIKRHSELIGDLANLKTTTAEVQRYKQALDLFLPTKDELVNVSKWLDGISRAYQVNENFSFQGDATVPSDAEAGHIGFALDVNGGYDNLVNFLKDVEFKAPRYLTSFDDFDLKRAAGNYRILIHGRIFFR